MPKSIPFPTRRELVLADLRQRTLENQFLPGEAFPTQNGLARDYGVSPNTVREALSILEHEGHIVRGQGKRAITARRARQITRDRTVAMVIRAHGHVFGPMASRLSASLHKRGFYYIWTNGENLPWTEVRIKLKDFLLNQLVPKKSYQFEKLGVINLIGPSWSTVHIDGFHWEESKGEEKHEDASR